MKNCGGTEVISSELQAFFVAQHGYTTYCTATFTTSPLHCRPRLYDA
jgi:hypothetical protein